MGRTQSVELLLSAIELQQLTAAAKRAGIELSVYIRVAAVNAAAETIAVHRPTYTRGQLINLHRQATITGHIWAEEELRQRGLPLYWCEGWVRRRIAEGATRQQMAVESGHSQQVLSQYLRRVWGIQDFETLTLSRKAQVRSLVASGATRREAAQQLGLSEATAAKYAEHLPSTEEHKFQALINNIEPWPATRTQIADAGFQGNALAAAGWIDRKIKRGWLARLARNTYVVGPKAPQPDKTRID